MDSEGRRNPLVALIKSNELKGCPNLGSLFVQADTLYSAYINPENIYPSRYNILRKPPGGDSCQAISSFQSPGLMQIH
jgi:hypothetical protein